MIDSVTFHLQLQADSLLMAIEWKKHCAGPMGSEPGARHTWQLLGKKQKTARELGIGKAAVPLLSQAPQHDLAVQPDLTPKTAGFTQQRLHDGRPLVLIQPPVQGVWKAEWCSHECPIEHDPSCQPGSVRCPALMWILCA